MFRPGEAAAMRRAIELARTPGVPLGPNPRVGAVVLDGCGVVVGEGFHAGAGTPHAEVEALAQAGNKAREATVVVTLEPCNHTGRTGPCAQALVEAGVSRVVFARRDATIRAQGGADALRAAGVDVEEEPGDDAAAINVAWSHAQQRGRPYVTWKFAATLDGRSAAADGTSQWITGSEARSDVHRLRAECDAILVGTRTVLADDPWLTVRDPAGAPAPSHRKPLRAAMGLSRLPDSARMFDDAAPSLHITTRDLDDAMAALSWRDCQHVWLEGGPTLAAAFVKAGYVDRIVAYVAPTVLGAGSPAVADLGVSTLADAERFELVDVERLGGDVRLTLQANDQQAFEGRDS